MKSFRSELEDLKNPVVQRDIIELERKIHLFREGKLDEEKFRSLRLARGVYGQRQPGVQMVRIKIPYGRMSVRQFLAVSDLSDEYAISNLHLTTRQCIQIHFVSLDRTPELWARLEKEEITLREACGNTVRNVTASSIAGIDADEPFDISSYAHATFLYFLRNPICQDLGRKFKIAFSSSDKDTAFTFMHDLGFIPKIKTENGKEVRGFKVLIGGGLGAQAFLGKVAYEFLHEDLIIPFAEAALRVYDRYGERARRHKARIKYLINDIGLETFMELVEKEKAALKNKTWKIDRELIRQPEPPAVKPIPAVVIEDTVKYEKWLKTNVFEQKQKGFYAIKVKVTTGDVPTRKARIIADLVKNYAADEIRVTVNQGLLFKFVRKESLSYFFYVLDTLGLGEPGAGSTGDITACPGTDTCNLGISNSTGTSRELERIIKEEYPDLIYNGDIQIKISGCMNSCGGHSMASIGFHGSSVKNGPLVLPALQVVLGGGPLGGGSGTVADKILKVPSKRALQVVCALLDDYEKNANDDELFNEYYRRQGKDYFYQLLKHLSDLSAVLDQEYIDWGSAVPYKQQVGVGECAGVVIDLIATLLLETEEKFGNAKEAFTAGTYADSIYHSYNTMINGAKTLLLSKQVQCNTQKGIIRDFEQHFVSDGTLSLGSDFETYIMQINKNEPTKEFAEKYLNNAKRFIEVIKSVRTEQMETEKK